MVGSDVSLKMKSMYVEIWNGKKQRIGLKLVGKSMSGQNESVQFYDPFFMELIQHKSSHHTF